MGLKNSVYPPKIAQLRGCQGRANLSGMMTVVVDNRDPSRCTALLESAVDARKGRDRFPNLLDVYFQFQSDGEGRRRIQHVVYARHAQVKLTQVLPTRANRKVALECTTIDLRNRQA